MAGHPGAGYWIFAALCGVMALLALLACFSRLRRDRFIADTPLVRIRSAAQGYVRISGIARSPPGETMRSPLTDRPCVWWDYSVEAREENAKGEAVYRTVEKATSVTPFVLNDADGECLIGPVGADVTATSNERWSGMSRHPQGTPQSHAILGLPGQDDYRFQERLIAPGTPLSVLGELRSHTEFGAVDQKTQELLAQWKRDQAALLRRFDRNHDGQISPDEWEAARAAAHTEAEATVLHSPIERVGVVAQASHDEPFIIAPMDAKHLVRREQRNALLFLLASILAVGLGLWALSKTQIYQPDSIRNGTVVSTASIWRILASSILNTSAM
ncbi:MAG TPA: GIDE domain-containing protein [Steroidobacteraceae bacterium]|nr:GIDE domain-containing protein [Steroidobacteraceae bacterium]